ncbi:MAG: AI-2E family transporter [Clostridia bacterium]|nr:AI-2E family transporter [Clostridia bacterium]
MNKEKLEYTVLIIIGIIGAGFIGFMLMGYILPLLSPFIIAWFAAFAVRGPADKISSKVKISPRVVRPVIAIGAVILAFCAAAFLIYGFVDVISQALSDIADRGELYMFLSGFSSPSLPFIEGRVPEGVAEGIRDAVRELLSSLLSLLGGIITSAVSFLPKALIFLVITIISLIYFSIDLEKINRFVKSVLPEKTGNKLSALRTKLFDVVGKYVKSYLQIMLITFALLLFGFLIIGIKNAVIIAALVALLDLLPVLGVGVVLVPWSIFSFAIGKGGVGVGLVVLFVAYTVIRELIEPKILGKSLDMHPIVTLISLYIGFALFGVMGLVVLPLASVLIGALFKKDKSPKVGEGQVG